MTFGSPGRGGSAGTVGPTVLASRALRGPRLSCADEELSRTAVTMAAQHRSAAAPPAAHVARRPNYSPSASAASVSAIACSEL